MIYLIVAKSSLLNLGTNNTKADFYATSIFFIWSLYSPTHLVPLLTMICSFPYLYQVKHVPSVLHHSSPYKKYIIKEFAAQQDDGNVE
jgi:hypothetical protein